MKTAMKTIRTTTVSRTMRDSARHPLWDAAGVLRTEQVTVSIEIDLETIINKIAVNAAANYTGRSKMLSGLIHAKVTGKVTA